LQAEKEQVIKIQNETVQKADFKVDNKDESADSSIVKFEPENQISNITVELNAELEGSRGNDAVDVEASIEGQALNETFEAQTVDKTFDSKEMEAYSVNETLKIGENEKFEEAEKINESDPEIKAGVSYVVNNEVTESQVDDTVHQLESNVSADDEQPLSSDVACADEAEKTEQEVQDAGKVEDQYDTENLFPEQKDLPHEDTTIADQVVLEEEKSLSVEVKDSTEDLKDADTEDAVSEVAAELSPEVKQDLVEDQSTKGVSSVHAVLELEIEPSVDGKQDLVEDQSTKVVSSEQAVLELGTDHSVDGKQDLVDDVAADFKHDVVEIAADHSKVVAIKEDVVHNTEPAGESTSEKLETSEEVQAPVALLNEQTSDVEMMEVESPEKMFVGESPEKNVVNDSSIEMMDVDCSVLVEAVKPECEKIANNVPEENVSKSIDISVHVENSEEETVLKNSIVDQQKNEESSSLLTPTVPKNVKKVFQCQSNATPQDAAAIPKIRPSTPTKRDVNVASNDAAPAEMIKRHLFDSPSQKPTAIVRPCNELPEVDLIKNSFKDETAAIATTDEQQQLNSSDKSENEQLTSEMDKEVEERGGASLPISSGYDLDKLDDPNFNPFATKTVGIRNSFGTSEINEFDAEIEKPLAGNAENELATTEKASRPAPEPKAAASSATPKEEKKRKPLPPKPW